jgi:hypothetical protein
MLFGVFDSYRSLSVHTLAPASQARLLLILHKCRSVRGSSLSLIYYFNERGTREHQLSGSKDMFPKNNK